MADFDSNQFPTLKIPKHMARLELRLPCCVPLATQELRLPRCVLLQVLDNIRFFVVSLTFVIGPAVIKHTHTNVYPSLSRPNSNRARAITNVYPSLSRHASFESENLLSEMMMTNVYPSLSLKNSSGEIGACSITSIPKPTCLMYLRHHHHNGQSTVNFLQSPNIEKRDSKKRSRKHTLRGYHHH